MGSRHRAPELSAACASELSAATVYHLDLCPPSIKSSVRQNVYALSPTLPSLVFPAIQTKHRRTDNGSPSIPLHHLARQTPRARQRPEPPQPHPPHQLCQCLAS